MLKMNFSPAFFGLIVVSFFLPFVNLSCSGTKLSQFSGIDLAVGKTVEPPKDAAQGGKKAKAEKVQEFPATIALLGAIAGLVLSFVAVRKKKLSLAVAGGVVFLSVVILQVKVANELSQGEYAGLIQADYLIGYYMVFLLSLVVCALNGYLVLQEKNKS